MGMPISHWGLLYYVSISQSKTKFKTVHTTCHSNHQNAKDKKETMNFQHQRH
jgi:hypothetical protein